MRFDLQAVNQESVGTKSFKVKLGAVAMAAVVALSSSVMWASPVAAQSEVASAEVEALTVREIREEVQAAGFTAAAELLGMTPEEVADALWGGETLADLAEAAGVPLSAVRAAVEEATQAARQAGAREMIAQLVENGRITQERADWVLEGMENGWFGMGRFADRFDGFGREGFGLGRGRVLNRLHGG